MIEQQEVVISVSEEMLADQVGFGAAVQHFLTATPVERAALADAARERRARERAAADRRPLTLDALLDHLGFSREYAEHLVQPYCSCGDSNDGWNYCQHARDEGLAP